MSDLFRDRHAKLGCMVLRLFPKVMQTILRSYVTPPWLKQKYLKQHFSFVLAENEIVLMDKLPNLDEFTIEICYKILRSENILDEPKCKWGNVPHDTEIEISDDIQRLINATNSIKNIKSEEVTENYFEKLLEEIRLIVTRNDSLLQQDTLRSMYNSLCRSETDSISILQDLIRIKAIDEKEEANAQTQTSEENTTATEESFAQAPVKYNLPVSVTLRQQFNIKKSKNENLYIISCIKIGNTLVFTDSSNNRLIICNSDGTDIHHIPLSYIPCYMTQIDSNTVAVSCSDRTILIINISTGSVTSTINTNSSCYGISYNYNNLYVVIDGSIIHVMDLTGKVIRTIPLPSDRIHDITVDRDRLVYRDITSIYCCSLDGQLIWKFKKDGFQDLRRVTTDNEGNVYVTNCNTVVVISHDGIHYREIITKSDGLKEPWGIYFDKKNKILLVCNDDDAFLFDVKQNENKHE